MSFMKEREKKKLVLHFFLAIFSVLSRNLKRIIPFFGSNGVNVIKLVHG